MQAVKIVASQESSLHLFLQSWNQCIRILDHAIINQFIYGTIKLKKKERWEPEHFDGKLEEAGKDSTDSDA